MDKDKKKIGLIFAGIAGCIVLYWLLFQTDRFVMAYNTIVRVLMPFLVGAVLAFILNVPMRAIERMLGGIKKQEVRRPVAVLLTLLAVILVLSLAIGLLIPQVLQTGKSFIDKLPGFFNNVQKDFFEFLNNNPQMLAWAQDNIDLKSLNIGSMVKEALDVVL